MINSKSMMFPYVALKIIAVKYGNKVQVRHIFARTIHFYMPGYPASVSCHLSVSPKGKGGAEITRSVIRWPRSG